MNTIKQIIRADREYIPSELFNKTYDYFSFDVLSDSTPVQLVLGDFSDGKINTMIITGLEKRPLKDNHLTSFLESIKIDNSYPVHPLSLDLRFARERYGVNIPVVRR